MGEKIDIRDPKWRSLAEKMWEMETADEHPLSIFEAFCSATGLFFAGLGSGNERSQQTIDLWGEFNDYWGEILRSERENSLSA